MLCCTSSKRLELPTGPRSEAPIAERAEKRNEKQAETGLGTRRIVR